MTRVVILACVVLCSLIPAMSSKKNEPETIWKKIKGIPSVCHRSLGGPDSEQCFEMRECDGDPDDAPNLLPESPGDLGPTILLYNKNNRDFAVELNITHTTEEYEKSGFDKTKECKILVQGIWSPNLYGLMEHIKEAFYIKKEGPEGESDFATELNIFMVNWVSLNDVGTVDLQKIRRTYKRPAQNTRLVGRVLGRFMVHLNEAFGVSYDKMHLIGYNLGAHVAGYAGKYIFKTKQQKPGRISGLAPSSPYFESLEDNDKGGKDALRKPVPIDAACRLDKGDAQFVDVIHGDIPSIAPSDRNTLGMNAPIGHVDFYPNDGKDPHPGCKYMFCSHGRPMTYYEHSILGTCKYKTRECTKGKYFVDPTKCPKKGGKDDCPVMGYFTDPGTTGQYCIDVQADEPHCVKQGGRKPK